MSIYHTAAQSESALNRETSPKTEAASQTNARPPQNRAPTAGGQNFRRGRRGGGQSQNQGQRTQQNFNRPGGGHRQQTVSGSSGGGGGGFGQFGGGSGFQQRGSGTAVNLPQVVFKNRNFFGQT